MPQNENASKRPLIEVLDDAIKMAMRRAKLEERALNPVQYEVLETVYETIVTIIGDDAQINLHPAFTSGGIKIVTEAVSLDGDEVSRLRTALSECSTLSIESLDNGKIEVGVTIPDVFYPSED